MTFADISEPPINVCFRGKSRHRFQATPCLLLTQSGHDVDAKGHERIGRALGHNRLISEQSEPLPFDFAGQRTLIGVEEHGARHFELAQEVKNL
jgi:hypothetical protein